MEQLRDCVEAKKRQLPSIDVQSSLKEEILQLQKQLENQFVVRSALEKALSHRPLFHDPMNENSISKPAKDLIKEIAVLELEVVYLEKYLLSLYRKTFDGRVSSLSTLNEIKRPDSSIHKRSLSDVPGDRFKSKKKSSVINSSSSLQTQDSIGKFVDSGIHRCHSSLSQSACNIKTSPPRGTLAEAVDSFHSLPLSMLERAQDSTSNSYLVDHLGTSISKSCSETPNWLSEEMIKCISSIYCQLADPPLFNHNFTSSPASFSSSMSESSPQVQYDMWSPQTRETSSVNSWFNNPFHSEGSKEFSGSFCSTLIEVKGICRDSQRFRCVEHMLQSFRSLVSRLEDIDPRKMKQEEKLAFWINVHNALVMHAFLVYGIPQNSLKRISLLLKAAYIVGGHTISVDMIQCSILGCRLPRPGQWFQTLLFPKAKLKGGDARKAYAVDYHQPQLKFALCSGSLSDPPVRIYTPKSVFQELEMAKEEYIQTTSRIRNNHKILLPKIIESYAKESDLCSVGLYEMILHSMPDSLRKRFQQPQQGKFSKKIEWVPHNFNFRYLLSRELAK
ncbi:hypothetical protein LguiB_022204 [Lonicera macranthoides]